MGHGSWGGLNRRRGGEDTARQANGEGHSRGILGAGVGPVQGRGVQGSALLRWTKEGTLDMPWVRTLLIADLIHVVQSYELKPPAVEGPGVPEMTKKLVH